MLKPLTSITSPKVGYSLFLLTLLLIAAAGSLATLNSAQAQSANGVYDTDGDGLIEVSNLAQLDAIRYDPSGAGSPSPDDRVAYYGAFPGAVAGMGCPNGDCSGYELVADLDFDTNGSDQADAGDAYWNDGAGWEPIGRYSATFDGNGHTIANLFINRTNEDDVGLFGSSGGVIRNIGLLAANVAGGSNVGGLVGSLSGHGNISSSYATGAVAGSGDNVGGLVGETGDSSTSISDSHATGAVTGVSQVGGLAGSSSGSITDSYATGDVTGSRGNVGGLAGSSDGITGSYATGDVTGGSWNVGGLAGSSGSIAGSYATGAVTGSGDNVGGLAGYSGSIAGSYATGAVTGSGDNVGGLAGSFSRYSSRYIISISISDSYATGAVTGSGDNVGGLAGRLRSSRYGSHLSISDSYATGAVTGASHVGGLAGSSSSFVGLPGSNYGSFSNHSISGSYATGAVTGEFGVGGLVGSLRHSVSISGSYATGAVTGSGDNVGGLAGSSSSYSSNISDSYATGAVTGSGDNVGGLVGSFSGDISGSYATGAVAGSGDNVGGLVGSGGDISGSYAMGAVTGGSQVGGLVGSGSSIRGSYATGAVAGSGDNVGGLVGSGRGISNSYATGAVAGSGDNVGGLVGSGGSSISGSYAMGAVTGDGDNVGGLAGSFSIGSRSNYSISNSYATGAVTGEFNVGGLVGRSEGNISTSYATGYVSGTGAIGGLVGSSTGTTTDSYWDTETSGQLYSDGGSSKTTAELQSPTGYTGIYAAWDDTEAGDVWDFGDGSQYPALKADLDGDGTATAWEFGGQGRTAPPMPPGTATISSVTPGPGSLTVSWRAPSGDVSGITAYDLRHIRVGADQAVEANWTVVDNAWTGSGLLQYVLTGLTNGTQYGVQVRAVNSIGDGSWSGTATGTPQTVPSSPANQRYSWEGSTTVLSWDAVAGADYYKIYYDDSLSSSCRLSSSGSSSFCEELAANVEGTSYTHTSPDDDDNYYWVTACNSGGCSEIDSENPASLEGSAPAPDLVVDNATVSDRAPAAGGSFTLSAVVRNQGNGSSASTTLRYYRSTDSTITSGDTEVGTDSVSSLDPSESSPQTISLSAPSTLGTYYYGACVDAVDGEANTSNDCSDGVKVTVVAVAPGAPTELSATASGPTEIVLSWNAPAYNGGEAITGYRIEMSPDESGWSDLVADSNSTSTNYTHTGLVLGDTRHYRVSAINPAGTGPVSNIASATTAATASGNASAARSFSSASVEPGGQVTVTITAANYGTFGRVTETLPRGFAYVSSSLSDSQVTEVDARTVRFNLLGNASFTYTVTASSVEDSYSFSGTLRDSDRNEHVVGGAATVTVSSGDPLVARYDVNGDGAIDIGELFTAIDDYFAGLIGIGELFTLIDLYFSGPA